MPAPTFQTGIRARAHAFTTRCPWHLLEGADPLFCWREGPQGDVWFAVGEAQEFISVDACRQSLRALTPHPDLPPRAFAVVSFDPRRPAREPWNGFPLRRCVLPQLLIRWSESGNTNVLDLTGDFAGRIHQLLQEPRPLSRHGGIRILSHFPREDWRRAVHSVREEIERGSIHKAVLSRQVTAAANAPLSPSAVLQKLSADAGDSVLFAYHRPGAGTFLGATPERLFRLRGTRLTVDSLAGTRPRGSDPAEDARLAEELAGSNKDRLEQDIVTRHIVSTLAPRCLRFTIDAAPRVHKLATVQHLYTSIQAELREPYSLDDILGALHPTPATCGFPVEPARQLIAELEPEPRGLYAGLIGWIGTDDADFAVAIRSGLIRGNTARIVGGAGIVAASDPDAEYDECAWKMEPLRRAL